MLDSWGCVGSKETKRNLAKIYAEESSRKMDLRPDYDFHALSVVSRGPGRKAPHEITVRLAPDVGETFPDSDSVNEALRFLIRIAKGQMNTGHRST